MDGHEQEPIVPGSTWRYYPCIAAASWSPRGDVQHLSVAEMRSYFGRGFSKITLEQSSQLIALEGQLCEVLTVERAGKLRRLARKADRAFITRTPVALLFRVPDLLDGAALVGRQDHTTPDPLIMEIAQELPPPQFGECALIWEGTNWRLHELQELPHEAKLIQDRMAERIRRMASPAALWIAANDRSETRVAISDDDAHLPQEESYDSQRAEHVAHLATMRQRRAIDPAAWSHHWARLREDARQLAFLYWSLSKRRSSRVAVVDTTSAEVLLPGDVITQAIIRSLVSSEEYQANAEHTVATWEHPLRKTPVTITIEREDGESWQHLLSVLDSLGDEAVDTFCAVLGIALLTNGGMGLSQPFYLASDDVLAFCGRKMSNRVYTPASRNGIIQGLLTLSRIQVRVMVPGKRRGRHYRLDSPVVDVPRSTVGEYATRTGDALWQRREIKLGDWATSVPHLNQQTVVLLRKILSYHPQRERFAKRLGRYFALAFAADASPIDISVHDLLLHAGISYDARRNQDRTRKTLERDLQDLARDRVIGGATPLIDATPAGQDRQQRIEQCSRGWWHEYEEQLWRIEPAPMSQNHLSATRWVLPERP